MCIRDRADTNLAQHRNPDYAIVTISVKAHGATPGLSLIHI